MFTFLLIVQTLIAASLVAVILMQRSEGGGLGVGGSSSGFMTARGAADFLTRSTAVLGGMFVVLSIVLAAIAGATPRADQGRHLAGQPVQPAAPGHRAGRRPAARRPPTRQRPANEPDSGRPARPIRIFFQQLRSIRALA